MPLEFKKNGPDIAPVGLKKCYRPRVPGNGTVRKLAKINRNNSQIPRLIIDVIYIYNNCRRIYQSLCRTRIDVCVF